MAESRTGQNNIQNNYPAAGDGFHKRFRPGEAIIQGLLFFAGFFSIFTTLGIVYELGKEALLFFQLPGVTLWEFISGTKWAPHANLFGVWPLVTATLLTTTIAMLIAIPLGLSVAIYLSEYASPRVRSTLKPVLEVLAGIPTIVYGYFALTFMTPLLRSIFGSNVVEVYNTASAGLVMGILILPLISSMTEDALSAVPRSLREAAYGMGATKLETAVQVVLPAALSGIAAAVIVGISRAIGETMIVAVAAGAGPKFTLNPFVGAETMTGHIVRISGGDLSYDSIDYNSIFAIGLLLFVITLTLNIISQQIVRRFREGVRMKEQPLSPQFSFMDNVAGRNRTGGIWRFIFRASTVAGILALVALMLNIINQSFGYVAYEAKVDPATLAVNGVELAGLPKEELIKILQSKISKAAFAKLDKDGPFAERSSDDVLNLVYERVVKFEVKDSWGLWDSLTKKAEIDAQMRQDYPRAKLAFESWINPGFISRPQSSNPVIAGIRTALLGSLWTILFTILVAFPLGVGAAIYLEEYAQDNWFNRLIQTNINNLAGVPSIIYGILGLAIFVRALEPITSGAVFGVADPTTANGRTILSAGFTLALLVLPIIIINAQEAIRAVPQSLRKASYGIGATKWQTVWSHVLPNALPGILTGTILAISRAIGETAPLVVIGASTFITFDPTSPFSKFTTLPIQIYQWTSRPQAEFRNLAAAAIIVLMVMLLSLNTVAIVLRNRLSTKR